MLYSRAGPALFLGKILTLRLTLTQCPDRYHAPVPREPKPPSERGPASTPGNRFRECTYLTERQAEDLQEAADRADTTKAEVIRRALELYMEEIGMGTRWWR